MSWISSLKLRYIHIIVHWILVETLRKWRKKWKIINFFIKNIFDAFFGIFSSKSELLRFLENCTVFQCTLIAIFPPICRRFFSICDFLDFFAVFIFVNKYPSTLFPDNLHSYLQILSSPTNCWNLRLKINFIRIPI